MSLASAAEIRVLHVDDDPEFADLTATFLERHDDRLTVTTATSADKGLEVLADRPPDCIVSDYDMPGTDGLEFLDAVREDHPELPFILYTGQGSEAIASDAISAGVTDYLRKTAGTDQYELLAHRITAAVAQHRAERQLERQNDLFAKAQEIADVGAWEYDLRTDEPYWTDQVARIHGLDPDDERPIGEAFQFYHPDDRTVVEDAFERACTDGEPYDLTVRLNTADGDQRWVRTRGRPQYEGGEVVRVRGTVQDVTEQQRREKQLERFKAFLEYSPDLVVLLDENFDMEYQSPPSALYEWEPMHIEGEDPLEYIHPDDHDAVMEHYQELLANPGEVFTAEFRVEDVSGEWKWLETRGQNFIGDDPIDGVFGTLRNITKRKEKERELRRERDRLDEFASFIAHDLRNPLNVAASRAELADMECDSDHIDSVTRALGRMETLIDDLLTLAREGETVSETEPVPLQEFAVRCWQNVSTSESDIEVESETTIHANRSRLATVLENLFRNACTHAGGDVTVSVGELDAGDGFYVADDGDGIPAEERDSVFERGYSTSDDGMGIGLMIVNRVVEAHGWDATVTESDAGGARFEIAGVETE